MWSDLYVCGEKGSEGGIILKDEEFDDSCRITLEKCERYYAITCGIYGGLVHTVFAGADDFEKMYEDIKKELEKFISKDTTQKEEIEFYKSFVKKY